RSLQCASRLNGASSVEQIRGHPGRGGRVKGTMDRPMRADAQRNRARLLEAAVRAFSQEGPEGTLAAIAKDGGGGIGTLYRPFPTREALVEAAYRNELDRLGDAVPELLRDLPP